MIFSIILALGTANAIPSQVTQQGRILDPSGVAVDGSRLVIFRIYDQENNGVKLWTETLTVQFNNGYYATILGANEVEQSVGFRCLSLYPIYLEIQFDSNPPMSPRQPINSVPYAQNCWNRGKC